MYFIVVWYCNTHYVFYCGLILYHSISILLWSGIITLNTYFIVVGIVTLSVYFIVVWYCNTHYVFYCDLVLNKYCGLIWCCNIEYVL